VWPVSQSVLRQFNSDANAPCSKCDGHSALKIKAIGSDDVDVNNSRCFAIKVFSNMLFCYSFCVCFTESILYILYGKYHFSHKTVKFARQKTFFLLVFPFIFIFFALSFVARYVRFSLAHN